MSATLAFDVYATLIDTHGVDSKLREMIGPQAAAFSRTWRDKQLEYAYRRGLMQNYRNFAFCTSSALEFTCSYFRISLSNEQTSELLGIYRLLPPFDDVERGLIQLKSAGYRMFAFSNGSREAVEELLVGAKLREYFLGILSVDDMRTFKPNPAVYSYFLRESGASGGDAWLISGNPFDVIGAVSAGMKSIWVRRSEDQIFDPWGIDPTLVVNGFDDLSTGIAKYQSGEHS